MKKQLNDRILPLSDTYWSNFNTKIYFLSANNQVNSILFNSIIFTIPIIIVSLLIAHFSFGLIHKSLTKEIGIYKLRGATDFDILILLLTDFVLIVSVASLIAILFGIPVGTLILNSDNFLSFNRQINSEIIIDIGTLLPLLFIIGIIFGLLLNSIRFLKLTFIPIKDTDNRFDNDDAFWSKHYLDFLFIIIGGMGLGKT